MHFKNEINTTFDTFTCVVVFFCFDEEHLIATVLACCGGNVLFLHLALLCVRVFPICQNCMAGQAALSEN